ncbi:MAG: hypothetical protein LBH13_03150 [Cellulomonadaceae bacterium]|nr:hypothetical protein [Cellulomonadaceae bacterium]
MSRRDARICFNHELKQIDLRIGQLRQLLRENGINLDDSDRSIQELNDWFVSNMQSSELYPDRLENYGYAIVTDIAMYIGNQLIIRSDHKLRWSLNIGGKKGFSYQRRVITGFSNGNYPNYEMDIDQTIAIYGVWAITINERKQDNEFLELIESALSKV